MNRTLAKALKKPLYCKDEDKRMDSDISLIYEKLSNDENQPLVVGYMNMNTSNTSLCLERAESTNGMSCLDCPPCRI